MGIALSLFACKYIVDDTVPLPNIPPEVADVLGNDVLALKDGGLLEIKDGSIDQPADVAEPEAATAGTKPLPSNSIVERQDILTKTATFFTSGRVLSQGFDLATSLW